jgi:hypothetical protein
VPRIAMQRSHEGRKSCQVLRDDVRILFIIHPSRGEMCSEPDSRSSRDSWIIACHAREQFAIAPFLPTTDHMSNPYQARAGPFSMPLTALHLYNATLECGV